jgi:hypothetical protein
MRTMRASVKAHQTDNSKSALNRWVCQAIDNDLYAAPSHLVCYHKLTPVGREDPPHGFGRGEGFAPGLAGSRHPISEARGFAPPWVNVYAAPSHSVCYSKRLSTLGRSAPHGFGRGGGFAPGLAEWRHSISGPRGFAPSWEAPGRPNAAASAAGDTAWGFSKRSLGLGANLWMKVYDCGSILVECELGDSLRHWRN